MQHLRLAVVGLGTLGNEVVKTLGLMGASSVLCVDPDVIEPSNICRSIFYRRQDEGHSKAATLVRAASERFPDCRWEPFEGEIADLGWGKLADRDLIFGCVDRDSARLEMARISTRLDVPVCDGGLGGSPSGGALRGRVSYFPGPGSACFGCRLRPSRRRELLRDWTSDTRPCAALELNVSRPATPPIGAITAALQVELGLRALSQRQNGGFSTEILLEGVPRFETCTLAISESCPFHLPAELTPVTGRFADCLKNGVAIGWEWPVCTRARCRNCGQEWRPMVRKVRVRNCVSCGSGNISVLECTNRVKKNGSLAVMEPREMGLPADHLYTVWKEILP